MKNKKEIYEDRGDSEYGAAAVCFAYTCLFGLMWLLGSWSEEEALLESFVIIFALMSLFLTILFGIISYYTKKKWKEKKENGL